MTNGEFIAGFAGQQIDHVLQPFTLCEALWLFVRNLFNNSLINLLSYRSSSRLPTRDYPKTAALSAMHIHPHLL